MSCLFFLTLTSNSKNLGRLYTVENETISKIKPRSPTQFNAWIILKNIKIFNIC